MANDDNGIIYDIDLTSDEWSDVNPIEIQKRYDIVRRYVCRKNLLFTLFYSLFYYFRQSTK